MPNLRRPFRHDFCRIIKSRNGHRVRRFWIKKIEYPVSLSGNKDTVEAYEKRHQKFLQVLQGSSQSQGGGPVAIQKKYRDATAKEDAQHDAENVKSHARRRNSFLKQAHSLAESSEKKEQDDKAHDELPTSQGGQPLWRPFFDSDFPQSPSYYRRLKLRGNKGTLQHHREGHSAPQVPNIIVQEQAHTPTESPQKKEQGKKAHDELPTSQVGQPLWRPFFASDNGQPPSFYTRLKLQLAIESRQQHGEGQSGYEVPDGMLQKPIKPRHRRSERTPVSFQRHEEDRSQPGLPNAMLQEPIKRKLGQSQRIPPPQEQQEEVRSESQVPNVMAKSPIKPKKGQDEGALVRPRLSLFEELFPDEVENPTATPSSIDKRVPALPKLSLPDVEIDDEVFEDDYVTQRKTKGETTKAASTNAYRNWNLSILVLQVASPSLTESDFRRIAPKGQHIRDWVGPGDIFKVIPARDPTTLRQESHYFLVFPNPAYARAYQNHVRRLHTLAQTHTPTSIESPMAPPKGMIVQGEDVHDLLQNYTLLPPSQKLCLYSLFPPYGANIKRLIERRGYPELMTPIDRTGRSVLFWVEGFVPTLLQVRQFVKRDGHARGLLWALVGGQDDAIRQLEPEANPDPGAESESESGDQMTMERQANLEDAEQNLLGDYLRRTLIRWMITFEDENEARRFVRRWHLKPFGLLFPERQDKGDVKPLVHAEFMW